MPSLRTVFTEEQIRERIVEMAREIDAVYGEEPLVVVCVLKGAVHFFSDLSRRLRNPALELDFVRLSSYGNATSSSRHVTFSKDVDCDVRGKHVLIVEDVVDSGHSMRFLVTQFQAREAASLRIAALIDKKERREIDMHVDFVGFNLERGYIVGYGMDCAEKYRALPAVYELLS